MEQLEDLKIIATVKGEKYDPEKHTKTTHVKAITYHEMEVHEEENNYWIKVLVDI